MLTFQIEKLDDVLPEVVPLIQAHWDEAASNIHGTMDYHLNIEHYKTLEQCSMLHISTARNIDGELCGYVSFSHGLCHHRKRRVANLDAVYLKPDYRKGLSALFLLRHAENALKVCGVNIIQYSAIVEKKHHALFKRLGARAAETIYFKEL